MDAPTLLICPSSGPLLYFKSPDELSEKEVHLGNEGNLYLSTEALAFNSTVSNISGDLLSLIVELSGKDADDINRAEVAAISGYLQSEIEGVSGSLYSTIVDVSGNLYSLIDSTSGILQSHIDTNYSILVSTSGELFSLIVELSGKDADDITRSEVADISAYLQSEIETVSGSLYSTIVTTSGNLYSLIESTSGILQSHIDENYSTMVSVSGELYSTIVAVSGNLNAEIAAVSGGMLASRAYVFAYDTTTQTLSAANSYTNITFNNNALSDDWTHVTDLSAADVFTCNRTGKYEAVLDVTFSKAAGAGGSFATSSIRGLYDNAEILGSHLGTATSFNNFPWTASKSFSFDAVSGKTLKTQFAASSTTVKIVPGPNTGSPTGEVSASIVIKRMI